MQRMLLPPFTFFLIFTCSGLLRAQNLPVALQVQPWWNPDSTWIMAFPGSGSGGSTSIGLNQPTQLSSLDTAVITLDQGFSGRIYFFVHLADTSLLRPYLTGIPADTTFPVRYDFFEITYFGNSNDCANLSSVDQFGLSLSMATLDANGNKIQSRGYLLNTRQLIHQLNSASADSSLSAFYSGNSFIRVMSPLHAPAAYFNMSNYISLLQTNSDTVRLFDIYDGSKAIYVTTDTAGTTTDSVVYPPQPFYYLATFTSGGDSLLLFPDSSVLGASPFLQGTIHVAVSALNSMIYACDGPFAVTTPAGVNPPPVAVDRIGYNDPWSTVMRNFLVGFNTGYYNYMPGSINGNNSWQWNPDYAFQYAVNNTAYYNVYANTIQDYSNSYGFPFTDFIDQPLLPIYGCDTLRITLWADTVSRPGDYTSLAIDTNGTVPTLAQNTNYAQNLVFNFGSGVGCPQYGGSMVFFDSTFATGYNYTLLNTHSTNTTVCGNITFTGFPVIMDSLNVYPFVIGGDTTYLYIRTNASGNFLQAYTNNEAVIATISPNQLSVTLSNLQYIINPAYLSTSACGCVVKAVRRNKNGKGGHGIHNNQPNNGGAR